MGGAGGHSRTLAAILLIFILTLSHLYSSSAFHLHYFSSSYITSDGGLSFYKPHDFYFIALYTVTSDVLHRDCRLQVGGHLKRQLCICCHSEKSQVQLSLKSQHALHMWMNASLVWRAVWVKPPAPLLFFPLHKLAHKVQCSLPGNFGEIQYSEKFSPQENSLKVSYLRLVWGSM